MICWSPRNIEPADILFTFDRGSWISNLIWKLSKWKSGLKKQAKVSHVALYVGHDYIIEAVSKGIIFHVGKEYNSSRYEMYIGKINVDFDKYALINYAIEEVGIKYSFLQVFFIFLQKILRLDKIMDSEKKRMICSEMMVNIFRKVDIDLVPGKEAYDCTPLDIFNSEHLELTRV